jgi:hypothetical protein
VVVVVVGVVGVGPARTTAGATSVELVAGDGDEAGGITVLGPRPGSVVVAVVVVERGALELLVGRRADTPAAARPPVASG